MCAFLIVWLQNNFTVAFVSSFNTLAGEDYTKLFESILIFSHFSKFERFEKGTFKNKELTKGLNMD